MQWYDSNTRRPIVRSQTPPRVSGFLTTSEWAKLPISRYKLRKVINITTSDNEDKFNKLDQSFLSDSSNPSNCINVDNNNESCSNTLESSMFLYPESKAPQLVPIKPLQSSPNKGYPECEVCLSALHIINFIYYDCRNKV